MHVLLIGPRGSGKTSVGAWLAAHLARPFVDLDERALSGFPESTISAVWSVHGESAWRDAELAQLRMTLNEPKDIILSLGGGTPTIPGARQLIEHAQHDERAFVIYLRTAPDRLRERLNLNPGDRPPLNGRDAIDEIEQVLERREPIYEALADCICDTDHCTIDALGAIITSELRYQGL